MKKLYDKFLGGVVTGVGIIFVLGLTGVAYGAYVSLTNVTTGDSLTASLFNQVLENQRTLKTTVDGLSNVPAGFVGAFNLTSCPSGWIAADGTSGTPDLRGTFIRGMNGSVNGRDVSRTLGDYQDDTFQSHSHQINPPITNTNISGNHTHSISNGDTGLDDVGPGTTNAWGGSWYHKGIYINYAGEHTHTLDIPEFTSNTSGTTETRPRNVALLYCVKQ